jgi:polyhydroxyalkanoate synthesis repressor PhaR
MTRLIKRYGNRKMYDTHASRYVKLDGVAELVRAGEDIRIVDNDSGEDLTAVTLAQIIYEEAKRKNGPIEIPLLRWMIQQGGEALHDILESVDKGREALENVRDLAEKRVRGLVKRDEDKPARSRQRAQPEKSRGFLDELVELPQKQLEQLQHRIDAQVRASIERVTTHPTFQSELRRIEDSIRALEQQLSRLRQRGVASSSRRAGKGKKAAGKGPAERTAKPR